MTPYAPVPECLLGLGLVDDEVNRAIEGIQALTVRDIMSPDRLVGGEVQVRELSDGTRARVPVLNPASGEWDGTYLGLALPHQQTSNKPSMVLRAIAAGMMMPDARVAMLGNNGMHSRDDAYTLTPAELSYLSVGYFKPFAQKQARILEDVCRNGRVMLSGYSLGGRTVVGVAAQDPDFEIVGVDAVEIPSERNRSPSKLKSDFLRSGGFGDQRLAIADSGIAALERDIYGRVRLSLDHVRFGVATRRQANKALHVAMAGSVQPELTRVSQRGVRVMVGIVAGSLVCGDRPPEDDNRSVVIYGGPGTHRHPTGDNPIALALMFLNGLRHARAA